MADTERSGGDASDSAAFAIRNILQINAEADRGEEEERRDGVSRSGGGGRWRPQGRRQRALSNKTLAALTERPHALDMPSYLLRLVTQHRLRVPKGCFTHVCALFFFIFFFGFFLFLFLSFFLCFVGN